MKPDDIVNSSDIRSLALRVGVKDRGVSGWCHAHTSTLAPGVIVEAGMKVVDVGCGDGSYISFCHRQGAEVKFIDVQEDKVKRLEQRLREENNGATVEGIVSNCDPIPIEDGYADIVLSTEVLEHVRDPKAVLSEMVRIGKESATYCLTVPDARGENMIRNIAPPQYFQEPNHIQTFSSDDFEALADSCGLEVLRHEYLSGFWSIFWLLKWATCEPGESIVDTVHPTTYLWSRTWEEVLNHPKGEQIREALNQALPRTQVIVARRKGADVS